VAAEVGMEDAVVTARPVTPLGPPERAPGASGPADVPRPSGAAAMVQPLLDRDLREHPTAFEFFQAVRLLERMHPERAPVGGFADPADETVRFAANPAIGFPPSEVHAIELPEAGESARVAVNFMGLTGPMGVMPLDYSLQVLDRMRARDHAMREFYDIFNHRIVSLFYRAWERYQLDVGFERDRRDRFTQHLLDFLGLGTDGLQGRLPFADEALLFYVGLLALPTRPAVALEAVLEDFFGVPAEVEQFVGAWYAIDETTQGRVGDDGPSGQLGLGAVAGDEVWDLQSRARIRLGPMSRREYDRFLPDGDAHQRLRALVRFFGGDQIDFEVQLVLARDEVPGLVLGAEGAQPLGWSTWIRTRPAGSYGGDADETILRL
jgi:type VI secretion system protein ImpH